MSDNYRHTQATRSLWNGTVTTLCGQKIPGSKAERVWFPSLSGIKACPACKAVKKSGT